MNLSHKVPGPEPDWRPEPAAVEALIAGRHGDPFGILGPHEAGAGVSVRVFSPAAQAVDVVDAHSGEVLASLEKLHRRRLLRWTDRRHGAALRLPPPVQTCRRGMGG